jgi:phage terminase small subunit
MKTAMSGKKLTAKQKKFVDEYLIDLNETQAAIRAGYSVDSARAIGCENLTKPNIQAAVGKAMAERSKRTGISQDRVVLELAKIAFVNVADVVDLSDGSILSGANADDLACIEGMKYKRSDTDTGSSEEREVKFASKMKALELLGKHLGMWDDKAEVNVNIPVVISGEESLED